MKFLLTLLMVLLPGVGWAADGDACAGHGVTTVTKLTRGVYKELSCVQLCDGKAAADSSCTQYDMNSVAGTPDLIVFEYQEDPSNEDCAATPDFTITTGPISGGAPAYDLDSPAVVLNSATNRVVLSMASAVVDRYLFTAIADDASCTDVDIRMHLLVKDQL